MKQLQRWISFSTGVLCGIICGLIVCTLIAVMFDVIINSKITYGRFRAIHYCDEQGLGFTMTDIKGEEIWYARHEEGDTQIRFVKVDDFLNRKYNQLGP